MNAALAGTLAVLALITLPVAISALGSGAGHIVASIQEAIPLLQGRGSIDIPAGGSSSVGAAPVADSLPAYTREPQLQLTGKVPSFAVQEGRSLQVLLNGAVVSAKPLDPSGAFNAALALKEGANSIGVAIIADNDVVASSSYTVVLDRTPPTVRIERPASGSTVDAQNIVVAGTTEQGSTITVNGRVVVTTPEGAFTDSFSAGAGPVAITVVARDRAGNETTQRATVIAQQATQAAGLSITVTVNKATARPGEGLIATVFVSGVTGSPRAGVVITGSVGVTAIGSAVTDSTGIAQLSFTAPATEGDVSVVILAGGSSGRASLTISAR